MSKLALPLPMDRDHAINPATRNALHAIEVQTTQAISGFDNPTALTAFWQGLAEWAQRNYEFCSSGAGQGGSGQVAGAGATQG